jgi:hypothetical protein
MMVIIITCDELTSVSASCDPVRMSDVLCSMFCRSCFLALDLASEVGKTRLVVAGLVISRSRGGHSH